MPCLNGLTRLARRCCADWTPVSLSFNQNATLVAVSITIDGAKSHCAAEPFKFTGAAVTFPGIASKTDCLGKVLTGTGALPGDLKVTYNPAKDTLALEVDSEGVTAVMRSCRP